MPQNQTNILAVVPGRHRLGVAVFQGGYLCYYRGKSLRQFRSEKSLQETVRKFLVKLVARYEVNHLAMQELIPQQQKASRLLVAVAAEIKTFAETEGIKLHQYNPLYVHQMFCLDEPATQKNTAWEVAKRYPELERYLRRTKDWEKRYYRYIFSAVALGAVCFEELKNRKNV